METKREENFDDYYLEELLHSQREYELLLSEIDQSEICKQWTNLIIRRRLVDIVFVCVIVAVLRFT